MNGKEIVIIQRRLTHYRVDFFNELRQQVENRGGHLTVAVGSAKSEEMSKSDQGHLDWAESMPTRYFFADRLCWQPIHRYIANASLLVVTQENSLIANHLMLINPLRPRLAFWGHGANLQSSNRDSLSERYKRWSTRQVDWWFAYTKMSVSLVEATGFPSDRITCLNNAIDIRSLEQDWRSVTKSESRALRSKLGLKPGFTGVYIGSLYAEKRISFLLEAAEIIKTLIPAFNLLIIGAGPLEYDVARFAENRDWVCYVGSQRGREKALYLSLGDVLLNPGLVGLNILDSFACRLPMFTTDCRLHSPEVAYIDRSNGVIAGNSIDEYVRSVVRVYRNEQELNMLRDGCANAAAKYTLTAMVDNFVEGIEGALGRR